MLTQNSQNLLNSKFNPFLYNNFYQKIIDYNKNVATKITNDEVVPVSVPNGIIVI